MKVALDTSVLLDVLGADSQFGERSRDALKTAWAGGPVVICDVVLAEVSAFFPAGDEPIRLLEEMGIAFEPLSAAAAVEAGGRWKAFRSRGGPRRGRVVADSPGPLLGFGGGSDGDDRLAALHLDPPREDGAGGGASSARRAARPATCGVAVLDGAPGVVEDHAGEAPGGPGSSGGAEEGIGMARQARPARPARAGPVLTFRVQGAAGAVGECRG